MSWISDLPGDTKDPTYRAAVLDAIASGNFQQDWSAVTVENLVLLVSTDALKIEGVRISVSATLQQQIADALGAVLQTPKIADLAFRARAVTLPPYPQTITSRVIGMVTHSHNIDAALGSRTGIVRTVGKDWVIDNDLLAHPGRAENYGWHFPGTSFGGAKWEGSVSPPLRVIQGRGWAHDPTHLDYSQTCCLVHRYCTVDGAPRDLLDVLRDPTLAPLVSHQGPLKLVRQPGVPVYACPAPARTFGDTGSTSGTCPMPPPPGSIVPSVPEEPPAARVPAWAWAAGAAGLAAGAWGLWVLSRRRRRR